MGGALRTIVGQCRPCGQVSRTIHPPGGGHQPAHTGHIRRQGNLHRKGLPRRGCKKARHARWRRISAEVLPTHTAQEVCQDTPVRHLQPHYETQPRPPVRTTREARHRHDHKATKTTRDQPREICEAHGHEPLPLSGMQGR